WTHTHGQYALMGGFVFDFSKSRTRSTPKGAEQLTLMPSGLQRLAEHEPHLIPDISRSAISDKSKADSFSKTIVCLQALWFSAQCVSRLAAERPISLLELNTLLHALCCLIVY
ncbi:hypothetical protein EK21DRAFT_17165, partial [Setomelanomma holmii]